MTDTAHMLADTTRRLIEQCPDAESLIEAFHACDLGLVLVPEGSGGAGCPLAEAAEIARSWGAAAAPLPIVELVTAPWLASGSANWNPERRCTVAAPATLDGREAWAEAAGYPGCERILFIQDSAGMVRMAATPVAGASEFHDLAGTPWFRAAVPDEAGVRLSRTSSDLAVIGALLTTAAMAGAMETVTRVITEHANTRAQFGRPIGKFQAVQHMIADAAAEVTVTNAILGSALTAFDGGECPDLIWRSAKAQAGRAASAVASNAHQVMGAIGFTNEHELHRFTKRLWAWRDAWGRQIDCEAAVGSLALDAGRHGLWPIITEPHRAERGAPK